MANRDLESTQFRQITKQVVENKSEFVSAAAQVGEAILRQREEAKVTQGVSQAQLKLSELENQYRIDYEGDPMGGMEKFKVEREKVFSEVGKNISPLYGRDWLGKTTALSTRNDATMQAWALKQSYVNTVDSVNDTIKNNLFQAGRDGQTFGQSDESEIEAFVNFGTSLEELEKFASKNLGSETAENMLETYQADYLKMFISGVAATDPNKAVKIMDDDLVKDSFADPEQYLKMKDGVMNRAKRYNKSVERKAAITPRQQANALFGKPMSYAQIQTATEGMSPAIKSFYDEVNGFTSQKAAVTPEQKADLKDKFLTMFSDTFIKEDMSDEDIFALQDAVYDAMGKKRILSEKEGSLYLSQLIEPILQEKAAEADKFQSGKDNLFQENLGLVSLNKEIGLMQKEGKSASTVFSNQKLSLEMYEGYLESLEEQARINDTDIAGIKDLGRKKEIEIYNKALNDAKTTRIRRLFPEFSSTPIDQIPSSMMKDGKKIPLGGGKRETITPKVNFKVMEDKNGIKARIYEDGRPPEVIK